MTLNAWQLAYYRAMGISEPMITELGKNPDAERRAVIVESERGDRLSAGEFQGHVAHEDCWCQPECVPVQAEDGSITYLYNHQEKLHARTE